MKFSDLAKARRLCFDTNALIYFLEGVPPYHAWLQRLFTNVRRADQEVVISVVTEAELLIRPLRNGDEYALHIIQTFLSGPSISVVDVTREVARTAAFVRSQTALKLPDAMIVGTAISTGCDAIIGNDKMCAQRSSEVPYVYLEDVVKAS